MRCVSQCLMAVVLSIMTLSVVTAEDDQVFLIRGGVVRGTISTVSQTEVTVNSSGQTQNVSVAEIRLVSFGDEPVGLREGRSRAISGKFAQAQTDLQRVDASSVSKPLIKSDLSFYLALVDARTALTTGGDKAAASQSMLTFVRSAPKSHHFFEAAEVLGDLAVAQGDHASAARYYGSIVSKAPWPEFKLRASLLEARALIDQGNVADAKTKYESMARLTAPSSEAKRLQLFAKIGRARCIAETEDQQAGIETIQKIIQDYDSTDIELFGRAYNALGDCYRVAEKPKDALMAYLHVDVLFYAEPTVHAESLYWISQLWQQIGKTDRAAAAKNLLTERYGGSRWASP